MFQKALESIHDPIALAEVLTSEKYTQISDESIYSQKFVLVNGINIDVFDKDGNTLLHHAVMHNKHIIVEILLKSGANPNVLNTSGDTPALIAIKSKYLRVLTTLCSYSIPLQY
jgi:ankyrin repeat protein